MFRIEAQPALPDAQPLLSPALPAAARALDPQAALMQQVAEIRSLIEPMREIAEKVEAASRRENGEAGALRAELDAMNQSILETQRQLAAIYIGMPHTVPLAGIADEIEAAIHDSSEATHAVLASAEAIQGLVAGIGRNGRLGKTAAAGIQDEVTRIFEACNFQDLTGQRLHRSVEAVTHVEQCIAQVVDVWGGVDSIEPLMAAEAEALAAERETEGSFRLVNGPRIVGEGGHIDQGDIDSLFD